MPKSWSHYIPCHRYYCLRMFLARKKHRTSAILVALVATVILIGIVAAIQLVHRSRPGTHIALYTASFLSFAVMALSVAVTMWESSELTQYSIGRTITHAFVWMVGILFVVVTIVRGHSESLDESSAVSTSSKTLLWQNRLRNVYSRSIGDIRFVAGVLVYIVVACSLMSGEPPKLKSRGTKDSKTATLV